MNVRALAARIPPVQPADSTKAVGPKRENGAATAFARDLQQARSQEPPDLKLSAHAQSRIVQRGIEFSEDDRMNISGALNTLAEKGARNALMLRGESAFLVNVPNRTIITAMDASDLSERAFTNIDSAYLLSNSH